MHDKIALRTLPMVNSTRIKAPFVARQANGFIGVESHKDAAFRNALLAGAPTEDVRRRLRDALINGPTGDHGKHALTYFGADKIQAIAAHVQPLTDAIDLALATKFRLHGFKDWLNLTDFGNDYRMIKAFIAWADLATKVEPREPKDAEALGVRGAAV